METEIKIEIKDEHISDEDEIDLHGENGWKEDNHITGQCVERYKCHHCEKSYKNLRSLNQHFREVQVCRVCKLSLPSVDEFTAHVLEDHTIGALCGVCMITFKSRARLIEHVKTHTEVAPKKPESGRSNKKSLTAIKTCYSCRGELSPLSPHTCHANVCKLCRKPLRTRSEFEVHMMKLHCTDDVCQFCGSKLPSLQKLITHLKSHTSLRFPAYKCLKCGVRFGNESRLAGHECILNENIIQNDNNEQESISMESYSSQEDEESRDIFNYNCELCEEKFKTLNQLNKHQVNQHSCRFCKKTLTSQIEYETHLMEEHSSKDECQFCMRKFVCSTALRAHLKTHTSITHKLHKCKSCLKKFASLKDKSKHLCLKYKCKICSKRFAKNNDRELHISTKHQNINNEKLECNMCSKTFNDKKDLKNHILVEHK